MRTKKEIEKVYREQLSINRIDDKWILKARDEIGRLTVSTEIKMDVKTIVDYAYDFEKTSQAAAAMGRAKTEKKAKSSRENGKKGGRPKQYEIITVYGDNGESETFSCRDFGKTAMTKKEWTEILNEKFSGDLTICFGTES